MLIQKKYPVDSTAKTAGGELPRKVLVIQMSGARRTKAVLNRILEATGVPLSRSITISDLELLVVDTLRRLNVALLILDEMQDILQAPEAEQARVLEIIKYLMNALHLPILALGPDQAGIAFRVDPHLQARFKILALPPWQVGDDLADFLSAVEEYLPLKRASRLASEAIQKALIKTTGGNLDEMMTRIRVAAVNAIVDGTERITVKALVDPIARPSIEALRPKA